MYGLKSPIQMQAAATQEALTTTAETVTIPNMENGDAARYLMVSASGAIQFLPFSGAAPADTALSFMPTEEVLILNVTGLPSFRVRAQTGTPTLFLTPLENQ